jgi:hypothetical protein
MCLGLFLWCLSVNLTPCKSSSRQSEKGFVGWEGRCLGVFVKMGGVRKIVWGWEGIRKMGAVGFFLLSIEMRVPEI